MKALTLHRPWPDSIFYGGKRVENRSWRPWQSIINETIALHAGQTYNFDDARWMIKEGLYTPPGPTESHQGIVGLVDVVGYKEKLPLFTQDDDPWFFGRYGWELENVTRLVTPIPCVGSQTLWEIPEDILEQIEKAEKERIER